MRYTSTHGALQAPRLPPPAEARGLRREFLGEHTGIRHHLQAVLRQMSLLWCEPTPSPETRDAAYCTSPTRRCSNGGGRTAKNVCKHVESIRGSVSPPHEEEPEAALGQQTGKHIIEHNTPSTWEQFQTGPWLGNIEQTKEQKTEPDWK